MIKAIFMDVDGTLLSHRTHGVPKSTVRSLEMLRQKGIKVFVCTGRHLPELRKLPLGNLEFDGFVTLNGQLVLDREGNLLFGNPLPEPVRRALGELFVQHRLPMLLMEENRLYINFINGLVERVQQQISSALPQTGAYEGNPIYQASVYLENKDETLLRACLPEGARMVRWNNEGVDVISATGGKAEGMKQLLRHFGLQPGEVMAFGDGENDTDMLSFAGIGVAMGNGAPCAKVAADYVTADIDDDGVEKALRHFALL